MSGYQDHTWIDPFSAREIEILSMISSGSSNREIANKLHLSPETVKWYNKQIFSKLGVSSRTEAAAQARKYQLLEAPAPVPTEGQRRPLNNLPSPLTSFIGREAEIAEIKQLLLEPSRLVVLTGPGGTGKTRLALQVARELVGYYRDGVWLVGLASLNDPSLVANAIAQTLNLNTSGGVNPVEVLKRSLAHKHILLLLDNFEHLQGASPLVSELLANAPQASILVTSREHLHIYGEQEYPVSPLRLPALLGSENPEQLISYDAINLFVQRARAVQPKFSIDGTQASALVQICVRLDGLPLALELAASQVRVYSLPALARRLQDDLGALPSGPRDLPARQRTLQATIEWSYDLLSENERILFARMSVLKGRGILEAIERICFNRLPGDPLKSLTSLLDKNLIYSREGEDGELYFAMLETIREYAAERLIMSGEAEEIYRLHAEYYAGLAEAAQKEIRSARQFYWYRRLEAEQDNLRSALAWSLEGKDNSFGLRIAAALLDYWVYNGLGNEGRRWTDLALEKSIKSPPVLRAGALRTAGQIALILRDFQKGKELQQEALELYRGLGDDDNAAWSLIYLSILNVGDRREYQQGIEMCMEGLSAFQRLGDKPGMIQALNILGEFARLQGDYESAESYYEECFRIAQETGEQMRIAMQYENLSFIAFHQNKYHESRQLITQGLRIILDMKINYGVATFIAGLAGPMAKLGEPERAARLLGASDALLESMCASHQPSDQPEIDLYIALIRSQLGEEAYQQAWQAGREMGFPEAVAFALGE
jgi:predicted ATPase/DNA-binding CsgD family transcriptional regulator